MTKYGLHSRINARKGERAKLQNILLEASQVVNQAKGCALYIVSQDPNHEDAVWVTEVWDTKEDHDDSLKLETVRAAIFKALPLMEGKPEGQALQVIGGTGIGK